jgi:trehalose synthase-fused probable maltokinase
VKPPDENVSITAALESISSRDLLQFIVQQRWFGAKGAAPTDARIAGVVVAPFGDGRFAIARVAVGVAGSEHLYQVPLASRRSLPAGVAPHFVVATADVDGATLVVYDAAADAEFRRGLVGALAAGAVVQSGNSRWIAQPIGTRGRSLDLDARTTLGSAEQSNTSIIVGQSAILKLFRALKPGVHPDVEVTRFLTTRAAFANTPALLATIEFDDDGERTTAGMLQEFLPGSSDAWTYALERGRAYFTAPAGREAPNVFAADAQRLGAITRAMHDALASDGEDPDFAPEPVVPEDLDRWAHRTQQSVRDSLALLERQLEGSDFPRARVAEAQALVRRRDHYIGWVNEIADSLGDDVGMRIRIHGDYHLGQVLHTAGDDFTVIDFEGEPSKSLAERREKASPLRDVAGMLRSIGYAAATLAMEVETTIDLPTRELRTARWERDVRGAYLSGYLSHDGDEPADILPDEEPHARQLLALFETEKAFYELAYELNNRPSWVWIPMRGISKLFTR